MRIALVQKNFHPNSVGLIRGLQERGHTVLNVIQYYRLPPDQSEVKVRSVVVPYGPVSRRLLTGSKKRLDRRAVPRLSILIREFRQFRPDIVIVKETRAAALIAGLIGRLVGAKVVLMSNKPRPFRSIPWLATVGRPLLPNIKFHMGHAGRIGEDLRLGPAGKSRLLPYPVTAGPDPAARVGAMLADRDRPIRIITIGLLDNPRKQNWMVVEAIAAAGLHRAAEVTFVGLGSESSRDYLAIRDAEARLDLSASEILLNVPHQEVLQLLPQFDLCVLPAKDEPFGVIIPEAMASGVPAICSDTCGSRVCFEDGVSGLVFTTDVIQDLAAKIALLERDRDLLARMTLKAYETATRQLSPAAWAAAFEQLLEDRSASRRPR